MSQGNAPKISNEQPISMLGIKQCILFVSRVNIRPLLKQELKAFGIDSIMAPDSFDECIRCLKAQPHAFFILDIEHGLQQVVQMLHTAQSRFKVDTRPIFLLANNLAQNILAIGVEYHVARIHAGEISRSSLHDHLKAIIDAERGLDIVRSALLMVADARANSDLKLAGKILQDLCSKHPEDKQLPIELAENHILQNQWQEAFDILDQHMRAQFPGDRENIRAHHLYARCLMRQRCFPEALAILENVNIINPYNLDRLVEVGNVYLELDRIQEARTSFKKVLEIDDKNHLAHLGMGQCQLLSGEVNDALTLLRQISNPRELASVFNNAAIISIRQGKLDIGLNLYKIALRTVADRSQLVARLLFNMGIALYKFARPTEAFEYFENAAIKDSTFKKARHNAIVVASKIGRNVNPIIQQTIDNLNIIQDFDDDLENEDLPLL